MRTARIYMRDETQRWVGVSQGATGQWNETLSTGRGSFDSRAMGERVLYVHTRHDPSDGGCGESEVTIPRTVCPTAQNTIDTPPRFWDSRTVGNLNEGCREFTLERARYVEWVTMRSSGPCVRCVYQRKNRPCVHGRRPPPSLVLPSVARNVVVTSRRGPADLEKERRGWPASPTRDPSPLAVGPPPGVRAGGWSDDVEGRPVTGAPGPWISRTSLVKTGTCGLTRVAPTEDLRGEPSTLRSGEPTHARRRSVSRRAGGAIA